MNLYKDFCRKLVSVFDKEIINIDEPMKNHTSFKVGGNADILAVPNNVEEVIKLITMCREEKVPCFIIGNGSNLLVKDGGIRGVVIKFSRLNKVTVEGDNITSESGATMLDISNAALKADLTGFEFACGIPGSIGGAVAMNAGAYNGEISNVIQSALIMDCRGEIKILNKEELELGYRTSSILKCGYTVLRVTLKFQKGEHEKISGRIQDLSRRRSERQPLEFPSAGSTFKRPEGYFAAKLIEDTGLKGLCVGGAEVSKKHSGFIINKGDATAKDIMDLIEIVQDKVKEKYDVELFTEVRIIGED
jgi:UDP-N-acetylmuramate dehydrogenase